VWACSVWRSVGVERAGGYWCDALHHVWVARLADADDLVALDANVRLDDPLHGVDDQGVRDDQVERLTCSRVARLAHALAQHLATTKLRVARGHTPARTRVGASAV
jgi:hypothetical protein